MSGRSRTFADGNKLNRLGSDRDDDREFRCQECGCRCTWNPDHTLAYGHRRGCPERDDEALSNNKPATQPQPAGNPGGSA